MAALKLSEDKIEAMDAELEYLRVQVKISGKSSASGDNSFSEPYSGKKQPL